MYLKVLFTDEPSISQYLFQITSKLLLFSSNSKLLFFENLYSSNCSSSPAVK